MTNNVGQFFTCLFTLHMPSSLVICTDLLPILLYFYFLFIFVVDTIRMPPFFPPPLPTSTQPLHPNSLWPPPHWCLRCGLCIYVLWLCPFLIESLSFAEIFIFFVYYCFHTHICIIYIDICVLCVCDENKLNF